jgi:ubiquitin-protein ligase E3 A
VLNPETKSNLLQIESSVTQQITAREQMFANIFNGAFGFHPYLVLRIHRERLIPTSLDALRVPSEELKKQLKIQFVGEEGIDEGGVKKEWFQLLVKELFDPKYGMFTTDHANRLQWFNPASSDFGEYELLGKLLGLAVYNAVILDLHFPSLVYKKLMGAKGTLTDLEEVNPDLARGLKQLLSYNEKEAGESVEEAFGLNFRISYEVYGHLESKDLIENGGDINVTALNRHDYVERYADFLLNASIEKQFDHFRKGFATVCDSKIFHLFRHEELELLICGTPVLDFEELERSTTYEGFEAEEVTIKNFWTVLHELSVEEKKRFLFFATGTDRAPIGGLARIGLSIHKHGEENRLPASHTCFAVIMLAPTPDLEKMRKQIHVVLENAEGFGMI